MLNVVDDVEQGPSAVVTVPLAQFALASQLIKHVVKMKLNEIKKLREIWCLKFVGI